MAWLSLKKIEKFIFYLFVFSIPFQTRKIFPPAGGLNFIEWNSWYLYFTDLLLIGIFILWIIRLICWKSDFPHIRKSDFWLIGFFAIAGLSLITSQNIGLSIYQLIKLAEFILLFLYIKNNLDFFNLRKTLWLFVVSGAFQSLLAIVQFFKQSSLGLKHFEAGIYNANIPGVATFFVNGVKFIRAYGTTPHPNVLGVFIFFSIFCLYSLYATRMIRMATRMMLIVLLFILMLGLLLTFSRAIIIVFIVASIFFFIFSFFRLERASRHKIIELFVLFSIFYFLFSIVFWPEISARFSAISPEEQAVTLRVYYNDIALSVIKEKPIFGLGIGNFVWYLLNSYHFKEFWLYQPVHNLYLLIASEIGIFGLILFLFFIARILLGNLNLFFRQQIFDNEKLILSVFYSLLSAFLVLSLIDHYFWTIQQSRLIFWIVLAIVSGLILSGPRSSMERTQVSGT